MDRPTSYGSAEARAPSARIHGVLGSRPLCEHVRAAASLFPSLTAFSVRTAAKGTLGNIQGGREILEGKPAFSETFGSPRGGLPGGPFMAAAWGSRIGFPKRGSDRRGSRRVAMYTGERN